jgi:membrane-associated protein
MEYLKQLVELIRNPGPFIVAWGYVGMGIIVFLETGALVALLPGDSMLVTAGLYASKGTFSIFLLNAILIPCAILGDATSYVIGAKIGPALFKKQESRFFKPSHLVAAHKFYEKHGGKAIIMARFAPLVRTFVPVVAGAGKMPYARFATYNVIGAAAWVLSMTLLGYTLGSVFPDIGKHVEKVIIVIILLSISPGLIAWWKNRGKPKPPEPPAATAVTPPPAA